MVLNQSIGLMRDQELLSRVKLVKHKGKCPTSLFPVRSSSCRFFSLQISAVIKCRTFVQVNKLDFNHIFLKIKLEI